MVRVMVRLKSGREAAVDVFPPEEADLKLIGLPPHTAKVLPVASADRGCNYHGSLDEEFYLLKDNPADPSRWVLWVGDTGSQVDDNQARLYPMACSDFDNFVDPWSFQGWVEVAAVLLYAYFRYYAERWEGYYSEQNILSSSHILDDERASEILADALSGKPLRWSDEEKGHPPR
jgi:hypothetical protein